ncbi:MAG TPA: iron-sulfur cluster assembly scaffold protein [Steroidobacteraceae bacterium]|nr:iron-sulfur cluster assembly scaffold protein [Steroidobacteraceae bacterium]
MSRLRKAYSPRVLELFEALPRSGDLPPGGQVVHGEALALDRGAWVRFEARIEQGHIADCRFRAWGCPHTLAAAALAAERLATGGELPDARGLARELEAPAEKLGRFLVVEDAIQALMSEMGQVQ